MPALRRRALVLILGVLLGGGFYLLLIDTTSLPELLVLAGVALACALGFQLAREQGFAEASLRLSWLLGARRLLLAVPRDIVLLCWEAVIQLRHPRPARGRFRATAFHATAATRADTGRRALTDSLGSAAPNTIVVGVDTERSLLLVHQLRPRGGAAELDPMRLG